MRRDEEPNALIKTEITMYVGTMKPFSG